MATFGAIISMIKPRITLPTLPTTGSKYPAPSTPVAGPPGVLPIVNKYTAVSSSPAPAAPKAAPSGPATDTPTPSSGTSTLSSSGTNSTTTGATTGVSTTAPASTGSTSTTSGPTNAGIDTTSSDPINRLLDLVAAQYADAGNTAAGNAGLTTVPYGSADTSGTTASTGSTGSSGAALVVLLLLVGVGYWMYKHHQTRKAAA